MKILAVSAIALALMLPAVAHAGGYQDQCSKQGGSYGHGSCNFAPSHPANYGGNAYSNSNADSYANSHSNSSSYSSSYNKNSNSNYNDNSSRATGGNAVASVNGAGNVSVNNKTYVPPPAYAPNVATGSVNDITCRTGVGVSAGAMGVASLGFGSTELDEECQRRENIKLVSTMNPALAEEMMNDLEGVKEAKSRMPPQPIQQQIVYVPVPQVQQQYQQPQQPVDDNQYPSYNHEAPHQVQPPQIRLPSKAEQEPAS